jgi:hypothetical protein
MQRMCKLFCLEQKQNFCAEIRAFTNFIIDFRQEQKPVIKHNFYNCGFYCSSKVISDPF